MNKREIKRIKPILQNIIDSIDLKNFFLKYRINLFTTNIPSYIIATEIEVVNNNNESKNIMWLGGPTYSYSVLEKTFPDKHEIVLLQNEIYNFIRGSLKELLNHELDECFYVNNIQIYDPHFKEKQFKQVESKEYKRTIVPTFPTDGYN